MSKKRFTDNVVIIQDRENGIINVRKRYKGFKKLFSLLKQTQMKEILNASSVIVLMLSVSLLSVLTALGFVNGEFPAIWTFVLGIAGFSASVPVIFYSANLENFDEKKQEFTISYNSVNSKFFDALPDIIFEEYFSTMEAINEIDKNIAKLHKALKKPMTGFLRKELVKKISTLSEEKKELNRTAALLIQESVEILESCKKVDELDQIKENDAEVLEMLEQLSSSTDFVNIERDNNSFEGVSSQS